MRRAALLACWTLLGWALLGCGEEESDPLPPGPPGTVACAEDEVAVADGCIRPGIAPEGCAEGFTHDGLFGCEPVLPLDACGPGLMAVPGDAVCRPVMSCGEGKWGDIPIDDTTLYVDGAYPGADGDGSAARPFTTVSGAYAAAAPGALIAIAAGSYQEDVAILDKPVRLWGVCPERVEIVGIGQASTSCMPTGVCIFHADGVEVHGLAFRGSGSGITVSDAMDIVLDRVWVHDATGIGVDVESALGPAGVTMSGSLVEQNTTIGAFFIGTVQARVEGTVVRDTKPRPSDQRGGLGFDIEAACPANFCDPALRANVTIAGSLVERNHLVGIYAITADATVENSVVRDTLPQALDQVNGRGINAEPFCTTLPCDPSTRSTLNVRGSVVERNHDVGISVAASDGTIENTVVRDTFPRAFDQDSGSGVSVLGFCLGDICEPGTPANVSMRNTLVERSHEIGISVMGAAATIADTAVRETFPSARTQNRGYGISVQIICARDGMACQVQTRASASVQGSLIEQSHGVGAFIGASDVTFERMVVRDSLANPLDSSQGDGVTLALWSSPLATSTATMTNMHIARSGRAGIANFGSTAKVSQTIIECAAFDLDGEFWETNPFLFVDEGGNACGCPNADRDCKLVTANLTAPEPLE